MTESGFELGLDDAARAGVFFVTHDDIPTLAAAGRDASLLAPRIDLSGCINKATMMLRFATALDFPSGSGRNWDALSDALRDLGWLPANQGLVLLLEHAGDLRSADERSFETLLDVLDEASRFWAEQSTPFWAFIALPEQDFSELL
ncbi:barstar family protein [Pseudoxanthomonas dokdonensis]|uniref:Barnase inhibitor n=1 Tax=Pseudoxanthomonas dokdonensis TaxID=344882 RepID=A0A0R0CH77_9GAMM|nr:barstar family protein [Pseudoxanthomonas dokdonensis]KRG68784.1 barnase inhibitor [Pseudoxanthomonas dokdonensis]